MSEAPTSSAVLPRPEEHISFTPRYIVEIGPGRNPLPFVLDGVVRKGDRYLGVDDLSMNWLNTAGETFSQVASRMEDLADTEGDYKVIRGDGQRLPVQDGEVDEVFMGNVLGFVGPMSEEARQLIREAIRVLKSEGRITILETLTPANLKRIEEIFKSKGFVLKNKEGVKDHELAKKYSTSGLALRSGLEPLDTAYVAQFGLDESTSSMNL